MDAPWLEDPDIRLEEPDVALEEPDARLEEPDVPLDLAILDTMDALPVDNAIQGDGTPSDQQDTSIPPGGGGWAPLPTAGSGLPPLIAWFAEAPSDPNIIIAGNPRFKHYHYRSTDGGSTWTTLDQPTALDSAVFAPSDAKIAYAFQFDRLARSTDGGLTWQARGTPPSWHLLTIDPLDSNKLYTIGNPSDGLALFTSIDGGTTWAKSTFPPLSDAGGLGVLFDERVVIARDAPSRLYATFAGDAYLLLESNDGGASWKTLRNSPAGNWSNTKTFAIAPSDANVFYHLSTEICRSPDRGGTWSCHQPPLSLSDVGALVGVDAKDANTVYVAEQVNNIATLYRSTDGGASWKGLIEYGEPYGSPLDPALLSQSVSGRILVSNAIPRAGSGVAVVEGIARSSDGGSTFAQVGVNLRAFPTMAFVTARNDDRILMQWTKSVWEVEDGTSAGYLTVNRGAQWQKVDWVLDPDGGLDPQGLRSLNLSLGSVIEHPTDPRSAFLRQKGLTTTARADSTFAVTYPSNDGLIPADPDASLRKLGECAIGVDDPAMRYCCTFDGLYRTDNGGQHWAPTAQTSCARTWVDATSSAIVYVLSSGTADARLLRSNDGGGHFVDITPPDAASDCHYSTGCGPSVAYISFDQGDPARLLAQCETDNSWVFTYRESRDRGATWTRLPGVFERQLLYPDPSDGKVLYAAGLGGVRKSRDGGQTWFDIKIGLDGYSVCRLRVSKQTPGLVYAMTCEDDRANGFLDSTMGTGPLYWTMTGGE
jgi:photosystem II stability/assembly factor-like uncharacterized protein